MLQRCVAGTIVGPAGGPSQILLIDTITTGVLQGTISYNACDVHAGRTPGSCSHSKALHHYISNPRINRTSNTSIHAVCKCRHVLG